MLQPLTPVVRTFVFGPHTLPDPGFALSPDAVRVFYSHTHPELVNASMKVENGEGTVTYRFEERVAKKG